MAEPSQPNAKSSLRPLLLVLGVVALPVTGCLAPTLWHRMAFRDSAVIGKTPAEIIARFGDPPVVGTDSALLPQTERVHGGWKNKDAAARAAFLALDEFEFDYFRGLPSNLYIIHFKNGVATGSEVRAGH